MCVCVGGGGGGGEVVRAAFSLEKAPALSMFIFPKLPPDIPTAEQLGQGRSLFINIIIRSAFS